MKNMTLENIAQACGGTLYGGGGGSICPDKKREASCVVIDSRKMEPGGIFIATKGATVDGHRFIPQVIGQGALGVVCEKAPSEWDIPEGISKEAVLGAPFILVEDSFQALKDIAQYYREQLSIPVVGITGSVGKTSTKEFIASVLCVKYRVLKTEGNFNNEIGLPLTVLSIRQEHKIAVLEMGISDFGEMHRLSRIARPDVVVMTNIGQSHLETLGSREGILKAKSEIFDFMNPEGCVFVNGDDDLLCHMREKDGRRVVHFGRNPANEIFASDPESQGLLGTRTTIHGNRKVFPVEVPLPGEHMVLDALAGAALGMHFGLTCQEIAQGIRQTKNVGGRGEVLELPFCTVIDGSYNANPGSMKAAIDMLSLALGRKAALLGDMLELGDEKEKLHAQVGAYAAEQRIDVIVCVGELSRHMYEAARACAERGADGYQPDIFYFASRDEMLKELLGILQKGDAVLVKASHAIGFEKVVEWLKQIR